MIQVLNVMADLEWNKKSWACRWSYSVSKLLEDETCFFCILQIQQKTVFSPFHSASYKRKINSKFNSNLNTTNSSPLGNESSC